MKLNLEFYSGKDDYTDGEVENKIIDFIKKYPNNYKEAFDKDSSWPILYHLSDIRKNVIRWYPFKKSSSILEIGGGMGAITSELCKKCSHVTTIELSKKRATAILERNKNAKNLDIIVGNFKDIVLKDKYDYILLNGVLEYSALYMDSSNPYEDFINKLKENLKHDGKILIAIENRLGLKYWCGANEDHTGIPFDGLTNYINRKQIRTFSKDELELLAKNCEMEANFYYMFPDYKFPEIIYTDEFLNKKIFVNYTPYYSTETNLNFSENSIFKDIYDNRLIPVFANSYFIEFSNNKIKKEIEFVKFNNARDKNYNLFTYEKNRRFYKKNVSDEAKGFYENYYNGSLELNKIGFKTIPVRLDDEGYYTDEIIFRTLLDTIVEEYRLEKDKSLEKNLRKYQAYLKGKYKDYIVNPKTTVFDKYNVSISKEKLSNLHFIKKGYIDIIPQNIILTEDGYYLIDQEWIMENVPCEFILYRGITNTIKHFNVNYEKVMEYLGWFNLENYFDEFSKLEDSFQDSIISQEYKYLRKYMDYKLVKDVLQENISHIKDLELEKNILLEDKKHLIEKNDDLTKNNNDLKEEIDNILNSKSWKVTKPLRFVSRKFGRKK